LLTELQEFHFKTGKVDALPARVADPWTLLGVDPPVDLQLGLRHETLITEIARTAQNKRMATCIINTSVFIKNNKLFKTESRLYKSSFFLIFLLLLVH
jgi:hypothetical protein